GGWWRACGYVRQDQDIAGQDQVWIRALAPEIGVIRAVVQHAPGRESVARCDSRKAIAWVDDVSGTHRNVLYLYRTQRIRFRKSGLEHGARDYPTSSAEMHERNAPQSACSQRCQQDCFTVAFV